MNESKIEFGKRLAEIRKSKKIKQKELKEMIDAPTVQMISGWENGHSFPSTNYLIILAKKLDISLDYLLLGKQKNSKDPTISTYKDAAIYITQLVNSGLFTIGGYHSGEFGQIYCTTLESTNKVLGNFKKEFDNLLVASKTLKPELFKQAIIDLLDKYDVPLKQSNK